VIFSERKDHEVQKAQIYTHYGNRNHGSEQILRTETMFDFEKTRLWKTSLGRRTRKDPHERQRERLRSAFFSFRENAALLAAEIPRDFDFLTVHDITHIDALWEMGDVVTDKKEVLSPLAAFVLGGAFLIHDLGMGLAAYPEGFDVLRQQPAFKDILISLLTAKLGRPPSTKELDQPNEDVLQSAKFTFIRNLHAHRAEQLIFTTWTDKVSGKTFGLLDDRELRERLGPTIGKIAHSHWLPVNQLRNAFPRPLGVPPGFPPKWHIDPLRLACILRVADAAHIDARRAPSILKAFRNPPAGSAEHWTFQEHIHLPSLQQDYLAYTSGRPFPPAEAASWWQCFETLRVIDRELRGVDALLVDLKEERLAARGVAGTDDPGRLAQYIPTAKWAPVDAHVKVGNVAGLVAKLGGEQLYGRDPTVPLRELIQNAADAIRARRVIERREGDWGDITIRLGKDTDRNWIEVHDCGVGMSEHVLTGAFLDFGSSLWSTPSVVQEFPNLLASGFQSTGKYGIGFFSVFMWGDQVTVITRRYDESIKETRVLEFSSGLVSRPLLRHAAASELLKDGGTKIRVYLREPPHSESGLLRIPDLDLDGLMDESSKRPLTKICPWLCPALDVNVIVESNGKKSSVVKASDWKTLSSSRLLERIWAFNSWRPDSKNIKDEATSLIMSGDQCVGRACLLPSRLAHGVVTVGGFRSREALNIQGILLGQSTTTSRANAKPLASEKEIAIWASEQAVHLKSYVRNSGDQAECAMQIAALGGEIGDLPIARLEKEWLNSEQVTAWAASQKIIQLIDSDDATKVGLTRPNKNVLYEPNGFESLLHISPSDPRWREEWRRRPPSSHHPIVIAVAKAWRVKPTDVEVWEGGEHIVGENAFGYECSMDSKTLKLESVEFE